MVYAILYKIKKTEKNYTPLYERIKSLGEWMHYFDDSWLLVPSNNISTSEVYDQIIPFIDGSDDILLIIRVTNDYRGWLPQKAWDWMKDKTF